MWCNESRHAVLQDGEVTHIIPQCECTVPHSALTSGRNGDFHVTHILPQCFKTSQAYLLHKFPRVPVGSHSLHRSDHTCMPMLVKVTWQELTELLPLLVNCGLLEETRAWFLVGSKATCPSTAPGASGGLQTKSDHEAPSLPGLFSVSTGRRRLDPVYPTEQVIYKELS